MKLLILDEELPYPLDTGKKIRTYNLVRHLAADMEIVFLAHGDNSAASGEAVHHMTSLGIRCELASGSIQRKSGPIFFWKLFVNIFSEYPYVVSSHYKKRYLARLKDLVFEFGPDLILAEWTPYAAYLRTIPSIKKAVVAHNIESTIWKRYYQNESNPFKRWYIGLQTSKLERFERRAWESVDGVISVSPLEREFIAGVSGSVPVKLVENGVDTAYFSAAKSPIHEKNLVFVGSMDWRPNQDAVEYFVGEIFPLIKEAEDDARVLVVGRKPPSFIRRLAREDIIVTGTVDDIRPFLENAGVVIVPMRIGGGSRLKILEAMAMNRPVVSTSVGAEGLEVTSGQDIIIADNPGDFSRACVDLMKNPNLSGRIADQAYKMVKDRYRWEILALKLRQFLEDIGGNK